MPPNTKLVEPQPPPPLSREEAIAQLAPRIREAYKDASGIKKLATRQQDLSTWLTAAEHCYDVSADPRDFVAAGLSMSPPALRRKLGAFIFKTRNTIQWYQTWIREKGLQVKEQLAMVRPEIIRVDPVEVVTSQVSDVRNALIARGENELDVAARTRYLRNPLLPVRAYLRIVLSKSDPEICAQYMEEAKRELAETPEVLNAMRSLGFEVDQTFHLTDPNAQTTTYP